MRLGCHKNDHPKNKNWHFKIKKNMTGERKTEREELKSKVRKCHRKSKMTKTGKKG